MNAKKIMGAVLVALLAAALFIGAGAAEDDAKSVGTVFVYQKTDLKDTWTGTAGSVTFVNGVVAGENIKEGVYTNESGYTMYLSYPTTTITAIAEAQGKEYPFIGGTVYNNAEKITVSVTSPAGAYITNLLITYPDGSQVPFWQNEEGQGIFDLVSNYSDLMATGSDAINGKVVMELNNNGEIAAILDGQTGTFKLQPVFTQIGEIPAIKGWTTAVPDQNKQLISYIPENLLLSKDVFSFTVVDPTKPTISADVDSIIKDNIVTVTITGVPGKEYNITKDDAWKIVSSGITVINKSWQNFTMPNTGILVVQMQALATGEQTIQVTDNQGLNPVSVKVKVVKGTITAATDAESYYIGNDVTITGTSTAGKTVYLYIAGTNKPYKEVEPATESVKNGEFKAEIDGLFFKNYDAGTYTVYVSAAEANNQSDLSTYATVALVLKQPFISITDAPSVAVQGTKYEVTGTAEAATGVKFYIFGTNYFSQGTATLDENEFTIEQEIDATKMDAGQYFMVVQHPMYDGQFNIQVDADKKVYLHNSTGAQIGAALFNITDRQKANAAEAFCQAIDSENIDDMYVKLSFVVAAPQSVINPIPETVAQGEKLTVSGTTNMGEGELVTVEMLSTAFAAVPKATVGSASFISLTTKTDENGNWEVTFDTSGLNVDEYTVTAAVEQLGSATAKVNVVEAAPQQPDQPDVPGDEPEQPGDEPEAPETPGFGALAALAGLGAVAVLLLRRE